MTNLLIVEEMKRLVLSDSEIEDSRRLKDLMIKSFSTFKGNVQHDAGDAYLSIIECLPDLEDKCSIRTEKNWKCLECGRETESENNNDWCMLLRYDQNKKRPIQDLADE